MVFFSLFSHIFFFNFFFWFSREKEYQEITLYLLFSEIVFFSFLHHQTPILLFNFTLFSVHFGCHRHNTICVLFLLFVLLCWLVATKIMYECLRRMPMNQIYCFHHFSRERVVFVIDIKLSEVDFPFMRKR